MVKVIGGAPPEGSGPKQLHFTKGEEVRFEIETSEPFSFLIGVADLLISPKK